MPILPGCKATRHTEMITDFNLGPCLVVAVRTRVWTLAGTLSGHHQQAFPTLLVVTAVNNVPCESYDTNFYIYVLMKLQLMD